MRLYKCLLYIHEAPRGRVKPLSCLFVWPCLLFSDVTSSQRKPFQQNVAQKFSTISSSNFRAIFVSHVGDAMVERCRMDAKDAGEA